jgi:hypothetical protein
MPICIHHDSYNIQNVIIWDVCLEKIAHAINKNGAGAGPCEWLGQLLGNKTKIEPRSYGWPGTPRNLSAKVSA